MLLWIDFAKVTFGITLKPIFIKSLNCPCDTSLKSKFSEHDLQPKKRMVTSPDLFLS